MSNPERPLISLCMIVRDEAAVLPRFVEAVRGSFDEFIAVDTGSRDASADLLAAAGARVIHAPWRDDFAYARNVGLEAASGRWILVLDADEFPAPGFARELRQTVALPDFGAASIHRRDLQKNGIVRDSAPMRVFPNDPAVRYRWRIHEDATDPVLAWLAQHRRQWFRLDTPVEHIGYTPDRLSGTDKQARDERLLTLALADDPQDVYSAYKLLELYRFWQRTDEARALAQRVRAILETCHEIRPAHIAGDLVGMIGQALFAAAPSEHHAFLTRMAPLAAHSGHFHLALGQCEEQLAQPEAAFARFAHVLEAAKGHPAQTLMEVRALMGLVRLAFVAGDLDAAATFVREAAQRAPDDPELTLALDLLRQHGLLV